MSRAILRDSLSVALTVGVYGIAFGAAAVEADLSVLQACVLSLLAFTGASQFAVVGVLGAGGSALSAVTAASLLEFETLFMACVWLQFCRSEVLKELRLHN